MNKYGFIKGSKELEFLTKSLKAEDPNGTFFGITQSKQILVFAPPKWKPVNAKDFANEMGITLEQARLILDSRGRLTVEEAIELVETEFVNDLKSEPEVEVVDVKAPTEVAVEVEVPKPEEPKIVESVVETVVEPEGVITLERKAETVVEEVVEIDTAETEEPTKAEASSESEGSKELTLEEYIDFEIKKAIAELREELVKDLIETFAKLQKK